MKRIFVIPESNDPCREYDICTEPTYEEMKDYGRANDIILYRNDAGEAVKMLVWTHYTYKTFSREKILWKWGNVFDEPDNLT